MDWPPKAAISWRRRVSKTQGSLITFFVASESDRLGAKNQRRNLGVSGVFLFMALHSGAGRHFFCTSLFQIRAGSPVALVRSDALLRTSSLAPRDLEERSTERDQEEERERIVISNH